MVAGIPKFENIQMIEKLPKTPNSQHIHSFVEALVIRGGKSKKRGKQRSQPQPEYLLRKMDFIPDVIKPEHTFKTFEDCTEFLKKLDVFK